MLVVTSRDPGSPSIEYLGTSGGIFKDMLIHDFDIFRWILDDEALAVEDHEVVMVPRGYHPVVVPYGYDSYYLNVMAGPTREWHFKNDPAHEWLLQRSPTAESR